MKIKRKNQTWRRWGRLLLGDVMVVACLGFVCNVPCGLLRVNDDEMAPALRQGDLVLVNKMTDEVRTGDVVLYCAEECMVRRVIASNDDVDLSAGKLVVNREEIMEVDATGLDSVNE